MGLAGSSREMLIILSGIFDNLMVGSLLFQMYISCTRCQIILVYEVIMICVTGSAFNASSGYNYS